MTKASAILITLVTYKVVLIAIGYISHKRTKTEEDFFLGGRDLPPFIAAISASASSSSAWTLLGVSGAAYSWGLSALWLWPACVGGFIFNWHFLAPRLQKLSRQNKSITLTQFLAGHKSHKWHRPTVVFCSLIVVFSLTVYVASQFDGAGKAFHETFGLPINASILLGAGIVILYTVVGGFWAVSLTDTLQGSVMAVTAIILPLGALVQVGGPWEMLAGMKAVAQNSATSSYFSLTQNLTGIGSLGFVVGLLGIGLGYSGQPHVVNRFMALQIGSDSAKKARNIAVGWSLIVYSGMLIVGWCGRCLFSALEDNEIIFIATANEIFPPVLAGVMLAAVLSAIMSTADSQLLVAGSSIACDLGWGDKEPAAKVLLSRLVVFILSALAVGAAILAPVDIFSRVLFAWTAMGNAFGPLLIALVFGRKIPSGRRLFVIGLGFFLSVAAYSIPETKGLIERIVPFTLGLLIAFWPSKKMD